MIDGKHMLRAGAALGLVLAAGQLDAATLRGRVLDQASRVALPGATIRVDGTDARAVSATDGSFVIDNVPDADRSLTVDYVGYDRAAVSAPAGDAPIEVALASSDKAGDAIVVTGTRLAERRAIQTKRTADNVVEALYANDVGKLPDKNVAEAIKRLPGLSVANDQGEGRYVIIRGVNPNLVNVVLNGQTLPAPEPDGRQVKLDDIPAAMIGSVVVTKTLTADQDANAIGGEVNIRTLTAYDRNKPFFFDARGEYGEYNLNKKHPWEADAQVGGIFGSEGQFGIVASFNYSQRPIESENLQGTTTFAVPAASTGANQNYIVPDQFGLRDYNLVRKRYGAVVNLDWHVSDTAKLFLRGTYSKFSDNESRDQNRIDSESKFTNQTATSGSFTARGSVLIRRREEDDNTKSIQGGGNFDLGGGKLDLIGTYTRAVKADPLRSEFNFRTGSTGATALTVNYDLTDPLYIFSPNAAASATSNYTFNSVNFEKREAIERLSQGRVDYTVPIALGEGSELKIGGKYLHRRKTNARDVTAYSSVSASPFPLTSVAYVGDTDFYDGRYTFGPRIDYDAALAFFNANPQVRTLNATTTRNNSLASDYDVAETIVAGYASATLKLGKLTLIPGVRVESTRDQLKAKVITATANASDDFNSFGASRYTDVFPGVNARFDVTERLVLRGAVTTAIGRPNYPDLAPTVTIDLTTNPRTVAQGNPDLKPYHAVNYDAAIEFYLPGQGLLSIGGFWKDIDDPIYTQGQTVLNGTFAGQTLASALVTQPLNAAHATVKGIEFNAQTQFGFLPSPLDGFGVSANYTIIGGHASGVLGRAGAIPLFLQSKRVGTAQIFYEKYGITARVAYTYRSAYLDTLGTSAATDQYTDKNGQLDARLAYAINRHVTVYGEGSNLTDAPWRRYIGNRNQLVERERYDYALRGGVQVSF